ncbi:MAG: glycoside hydrolase 43 family protein [Clostridia bacterium]|nr:glycoside hydrolase 43 family protein [Clostridia bacterium]
MIFSNPVLYADYPDPDVIRVGDTYYMVTTTMHMFPGGDILVSKDLVRWELLCHVFSVPDGTPRQRLDGGDIYGKGMWAGSLRYHNGVFYLLFVCNDTHKTYCFSASDPSGPWEKHIIEGCFFHDCSVLFDDDGRVYIVSGNREIHLTEMEPDLSRPKEGGLERVILRDRQENMPLGFEGSHLYKISGKYYLFLIHWASDGTKRRTEACWCADSLTGEFTGRDIYDDDLGFFNMGVAQGGIVDTPDGRWFAILFQDRGACGRMPVLVPMVWENGFPKLQPDVKTLDLPVCEDALRPLYGSDTLREGAPADYWQWNHMPDTSGFAFTARGYELTALPAPDLTHAKNTLTQRIFGPKASFTVTLNAGGLKTGDRAGLCALQGCFAALLAERTDSGFRLVLHSREGASVQADVLPDKALIPVNTSVLRLRADFDFTDLKDTVRFLYDTGNGWQPAGDEHKLRYTLDHFMGARIALCAFGHGGKAVFSDFEYIH